MTRKPELESALEDRCVAKVEALGGMAVKLAPVGTRGFPDRTCMLPGGKIFYAEFKRQRVGKASRQQHTWRMILNLLGFKVVMIDNDSDFDAALKEQS